jgi:hypothetical protein
MSEAGPGGSSLFLKPSRPTFSVAEARPRHGEARTSALSL